MLRQATVSNIASMVSIILNPPRSNFVREPLTRSCSLDKYKSLMLRWPSIGREFLDLQLTDIRDDQQIHDLAISGKSTKGLDQRHGEFSGKPTNPR